MAAGLLQAWLASRAPRGRRRQVIDAGDIEVELPPDRDSLSRYLDRRDSGGFDVDRELANPGADDPLSRKLKKRPALAALTGRR